MKTKHFLLSILLVGSFILSYAQIPDGYYASAEGKTGAALKTALYDIVKDHTVRAYGDLWTDFVSTDSRADGSVWDMYSNCTFHFGYPDQDSGSGGGSECSKYNREHSFPNSWFGGNSGQGTSSNPMYTDLFHMYPTDKYVNRQRGNDPFGLVNSPDETFGNGSKKGNCYQCGTYNGKAFEPRDEYKGDFARTYFYMVTRYENVLSDWYTANSEVRPTLDGTSYPALNAWVVALFLKWHEEDPVSDKETNRNNAVYGIQHNRNPYIDHPEYVRKVWAPTSAVEETAAPKPSVYPNPARSELTIKGIDAPNYTLYAFDGRPMLQGTGNRLDVSALAQGIYLLKVENVFLKIVVE